MKTQERLKAWLGREKTRDFLVVFAAAFIVFSLTGLTWKGNDPFGIEDKRGDNWYYYRNADLFKTVWSEPFRYFPGLLFDSLSENELLRIGFNHHSDFDSFFRAPSYIAFLSFWLFLFGDSASSGALSQAFLLGLLFGLIYLTVRLTAPRAAGWTAVGLSFLYPAWYIFPSMTLTELFQAAMLLAVLYKGWSLLHKEKLRFRDHIGMALLILVFAYGKLSLKYAAPALLLLFAFLIIRRFQARGRKAVLKNLAAFCIPFFLLLGLTGAVLSRGSISGQSNTIQGWRVFYAGSCIEAEGFVPNTGYHPEAFRRNIGKGRDQFWFRRYSEVCQYAVLDLLKSRPMEYGGMVLKRILFLLSHPPVNYESTELFRGFRGLPFLSWHRLLFALAIAAVALLGNRFFLHKSLLVAIAGYSGLIYGMANPDARFMAVISPFLIILPVILAWESLDEHPIPISARSISAASILIVCLLLMNRTLLDPLLNSANAVLAVRFLFLLIASAAAVVLLLPAVRKQDTENRILSVLTGILVLAMLSASVLGDKGINRREIRIRRGIENQIVLENIPKDGRAFVALDLQGSSEEIRVFLNGEELTLPLPEVPGERFAEPDAPTAPRWVYSEFPLSLLGHTNIVKVLTEGRGFRIGTGFPAEYNRQKRILPSFLHHCLYLGESGAGPFSRMERRVFLPWTVGSLRRSAMIDGRPDRVAPHLFILISDGSDWWIPERYADLSGANAKYAALVNPVDAGLTVWGPTPPAAGWTRVTGNLRLYLDGELDRFRSSFTIY